MNQWICSVFPPSIEQIIETECYDELNVLFEPDGSLVQNLDRTNPPPIAPSPRGGFFSKLLHSRAAKANAKVNFAPKVGDVEHTKSLLSEPSTSKPSGVGEGSIEVDEANNHGDAHLAQHHAVPGLGSGIEKQPNLSNTIGGHKSPDKLIQPCESLPDRTVSKNRLFACCARSRCS